ncbi:ATP-dependent permease MDL1, mitochondrial [Cladophialophora carrionii]|uniref:ABC multidrug transporter MDR2 n=1 Tax=Cladophialophora carrionii TaxID=86049 RepID=A0A1C1CN82_9EURO|nr:ATP-dependent permease MDL1, mitochondrial [Cladophialophora carrionii]
MNPTVPPVRRSITAFTTRRPRCKAPPTQPRCPITVFSDLPKSLSATRARLPQKSLVRPRPIIVESASCPARLQSRTLQATGNQPLQQHHREQTNVVDQNTSQHEADPQTRELSTQRANGSQPESPTIQTRDEPTKNKADTIDKSASENVETKPKPGGELREIWRLLQIAKPEIPAMSFAFFLLFISSGITMAVPFSIGKILDSATRVDGTVFGMQLEHFCVAFWPFWLGMALLKIIGERIITKLRSSLYKHTYLQSAEFFDTYRVGDLLSRLGNDTTMVGRSITDNLSDGLRSLAFATTGMGMMTYISYKLVGLLALAFPPLAAGAFLYGRAVRDLSRRIQTNLGTLTRIAEERLGNVRTSQAFTGERQEVHRYNHQTRKIFNLAKREAVISAAFFSTSSFLGNATFLALLYVGNSMVRSGSITVGDLTTFVMYTGVAGGSLFGLSAAYSDLMKGVGAASRLFELQDHHPAISPTKGMAVGSARGTIQFHDVNFAYPSRPSTPVFDGLSLKIGPESNVAIVAPSGAGKSTVASLLMRFYAPSRGTITINGHDISKMNARQLRRRIGLVGQEPVLFSGTIAENVGYGKPKATRSEILEALRLANCHFVHDFPNGVDTLVGARGAQLSGGQKQRIAIARALLKEPDILILDEATSALDVESEKLVKQALEPLRQGPSTIITITHRLSSIPRSDTIISLGTDGRVAQTGTYHQLMANKEGVFATLVKQQMSER